MQAEQPESRLTLQEVSAAFDDWRQTRTSHTIPDTLWQLVRRLKSGYKSSYIYATLRISSKQFHDNVLGRSPKPCVSSKAKEDGCPLFVEVPQHPLATTIQQATSSVLPKQSGIELTRTDGTRLTLTDLSDQQFKQILESFL